VLYQLSYLAAPIDASGSPSEPGRPGASFGMTVYTRSNCSTSAS